MTACAMTVGMVPMALALEQGSQMQAPLGRAVIGGLVDVHVRHPADRAVDLRAGDGPSGRHVAVDLPRRPGQRALRPEGGAGGRSRRRHTTDHAHARTPDN